MVGNVKIYGEIEPFSLDFDNYAVALFRIKITTPNRIDINNLGTTIVRFFSIGHSIQYKDIAIRAQSSDGINLNVVLNELMKNSCYDINVKAKIENGYAYIYAKSPNKWESLSYQILYAVNPAYIENLGKDILISKTNFQSSEMITTGNFSFKTPSLTLVSEYCSLSNDSQVNNITVEEFLYTNISTRLCITKDCVADTVLLTVDKPPKDRAVVFFGDIQTSYDITVSPSRVPFIIDTSGNLKCKQGLVKNNNVFIDVKYKYI